ncbi:hypothetical protein GCM10022225_06880 [Plantactinospora mayteni]|uniref:Uncharacterized protein n=1 Tax=Plantactinospora mayteni TaxID=566021 RepID=A0ABQ4ER83_9ACTN|nr:hypothetical protein [Plantactinospora mayteni]GIG97177.1 hypothetical protein Pma05_37500 [Plantactinospora mayteni]
MGRTLGGCPRDNGTALRRHSRLPKECASARLIAAAGPTGAALVPPRVPVIASTTTRKEPK